MTQAYIVRRSLALMAILALLVLSPAHPPYASAGGAPSTVSTGSSCPSGLPPAAVCSRALGLALTPPAGWTAAPPGKFAPGILAFWTLTPGVQEPPLHLVIAPVGVTTACSDAQAATAVAKALARLPNAPQPTTRTSLIVAGAPAVIIRGLPGSPTYGLTIVVAHGGLVYSIATFAWYTASPRSVARRSHQASVKPWPACASSCAPAPSPATLPGHPTPTMARALRSCAAARTGLR